MLAAAFAVHAAMPASGCERCFSEPTGGGVTLLPLFMAIADGDQKIDIIFLFNII
ncbi:hypothetical protein [Bradyrhizobium sp. Rc2d]|uniref:hypothetical protein n=1 Tax=Bradyrhizobium sp. Rc2d TaxID=1855321 RepID=UPI0015A44628|nr:hypothetical protein [Bradyrhizobium sp. Rc2d]